jgi:Holliday junction resolvase RusA-like endonuclease
MSELKLIVPLCVELPRKTKKNVNVWLNMNRFMNLHYIMKNNAKKVFFEVMRDQLEGVTIDTPVNITYQIFNPQKRKRDKMNAISVVSKFLLDAITHYGCWEDDNDDFVKTETLLPTVYDKNNGRIEVTIVNNF